MAHASFIAAGTELRGRLSCDSDLRFEGSLRGEITVRGDLAVGGSAVVEGPLRARTVTVGGKVRGSVCGEERVELLRGGSVAGDLYAACVVLGAGSEHNGRIEISS